MILIISYPDDEHIDEVRRHLTMPHAVIDTASFPVSLGLSASLRREKENLHFTLPETGEELCLCEVGAVWYRRIKPYSFHSDLLDETARLFAWSEAHEALMGMWYSLDSFWMNSPLADEVALRKIKQLVVARRIGLSIPDTLITNEPDEAHEFIRQHGVGQVVRKAFRNIVQAPRETHLLQNEDIELIDSVRYTPVIFQRFVPVHLDLRVTIIENEIFAAAISSESKFEADYRPGLNTAKVVPFDLPLSVEDKLLKLMQIFGLNYGAIDLRVTPDGDYVFFEVNPAGEFLFISRRTDQPIAAAIAASLERHDRIAMDHEGCC